MNGGKGRDAFHHVNGGKGRDALHSVNSADANATTPHDPCSHILM